MDELRKEKLQKRLKELDAEAIKFHKAKEVLKAEGYSDHEITLAIQDFSYDGKPAKPPDPLKKRMADNPEAAQKIGKEILKDHKRQRRNITVARSIASLARGRWGSYYAFQVMEDLGMPWFKLFVVAGILVILQVAYKINYLLPIYGIIVFSWAIYRFIKIYK